MRNLVTFLLGAVVAVGGIYLFHKFGPQESKTPYVLDLNISNGQRVQLKDPNGVEAFENQLQKIDPNGANGTDVNIKPYADKPEEVEGPLAGGAFKPPNSPIGPEGSVHNTQRISATNMADLQSVLDLLASTSTTAGTAAPIATATPAATSSPSP